MRTHASSCIGETSLQDWDIHFLQRQYGHYAITPLPHYAIMPLRHYASTAITPLCQYGHYAITPLRHYAIMPVWPLRHYASTSITVITPLRQYASRAITALHQYIHYGHYASMAITAITPVWPLCHSPHSFASVKVMYVEMGFPLNLYWHSLSKLYSKHWTDTRSKQEKCAYQPMILDQRYSNVGWARPLVNISPSCSEVSIFKSLIPRLLISSQNQIVLVV